MRKMCSGGRVAVAFVVLTAAMLRDLHAGGSGLNTLVVVNQTSTNSIQLANYYCERRGVPPENVVRINWAGGNVSWSSNDFQTTLIAPILNAISSRQLSSQIDYVALSMDIPFQTYNGPTINSTTAALFYGLKPNGGYDWKSVGNSYARSEAVFRRSKPSSALSWSFLATMLTADSLAQAKQMIDQGVTSDGTFPAQPIILAKSSDPLRNVRYSAFDNAILNIAVRGKPSILRTNSDNPWQQTTVFGYETGLANFSVAPQMFVPGAIADSMTSFGGIIFGNTGQTSLMGFINAGASGSYGTVTEPLADPGKFPDPMVYFYQARGFTLAEAYYQSLAAPYLGLVVGEPLASPFQMPATGAWVGVGSNSVLSGNATLSLNFAAPGATRPVQQVDLFVDGKFFQTITNIGLVTGTVLETAINGYPVSYTVAINDTLPTVASNLAALINTPSVSNATKVVAFARGDRIELQSVSSNGLAEAFYLPASVTPPDASFYRVVYLPSGGRPVAPPRFRLQTPGASQPVQQVTDVTNFQTGETLVRVEAAPKPYLLQASADQAQWTTVLTNVYSGKMQVSTRAVSTAGQALSTFLTVSGSTFTDSAAVGFRNYRVSGPVQVGSSLQLTVTKTNGSSVRVAVTNSSLGGNISDLCQQLVSAINNRANLLGLDGLSAEDFTVDGFGNPTFNLRARAPGLAAANMIAGISGPSTVVISPAGSLPLKGNIPDLSPRAHVYVSAGVTDLLTSFPLQTTSLNDGFHELTAVAYEGSHVGTQSRVTVPVQIKNTALSADVVLLDLAATAPVSGVYHARVTANSSAANRIQLLSTGGVIGEAANQSTAEFAISGADLGVGRHGFYAIVETTNGLKYRTQTLWTRLQ